MPIDWTPFVELVHKHKRFLLTTHVRPDPDGLGSMLGLAEVLEQMGKSVRMVISSVWPPRCDFLDPEKRIKRFELPGEEYRDTDLIVVLDTGTWNQLADFGTFLKTSKIDKVVIDHHVSHDELGGLRLADTSAEATGRLVYEALTALGQRLTARAAEVLFAALATDTGWFRHPNTTPATFELAGIFSKAGANPTRLYDQIYEQNTLPRYKLVSLALNRLRLAEGGRIAYTEVLLSDYPATGAIPPDTEDMINYTRSLIGVDVGLFFMEQPAGGIKVSFRSRNPAIDVSKIAEKFGGGGHKLASAAIINTTLADAQTQVLSALHAVMS